VFGVPEKPTVITHFHTGLTRVRVTPRQNSQYRLRMQFRVIERAEAVEIDASEEEIIALIEALQAAVQKNTAPRPPTPPRKRPQLHVVKDDE
jgi:hypothetical protein